MTAALGVIGFIVWLVRLEGKISSQATTIARKEKEIEKLIVECEAHRSNSDIHFNLRINQEVDRRNEHRFHTIETQLSEINRKLDRIAGRE